MGREFCCSDNYICDCLCVVLYFPGKETYAQRQIHCDKTFVVFDADDRYAGLDAEHYE